ncbi:MAG: hypothetical protein V2J14_06165 [Erythrobacter sp.]|nr:hypothetical protein [Erythrobacter sp.]
MTIRFAPAASASHSIGRAPVCRPIARALAARAMERVGNDNGGCANANPLGDRVLRAALRHFAEHGLGAARIARAQAEAALGAGDSEGFDWWLGITRTLDRRLARSLARSLSSEAERASVRPPCLQG